MSIPLEQIGMNIGARGSAGFQGARDKANIEEILARTQQARSPEEYSGLMGQILSNVSPERQQAVMSYIQQQQQQKQLGIPPGTDPQIVRQMMANQQAQRQAAQQQAQIQDILGDQTGGGSGAQQLPSDEQIARLALVDPKLAEQYQKQKQAVQQQRESQLLAKRAAGGELSEQELAELSPTSLRSLQQQEKPLFEEESQKLEAKRVSEMADQIEKGYEAYQNENMRLNRMERVDEKGDLSTPLMVKTLEMMGLPLGILSNPDTEEYQKLEADYLRDVRDVFPGGRITNYEISSYMKSIPGLMNSSEGKKAIIRNRRLLNEARKVKYDAYRDILKENNGKKPPNLGILIQDRIGEKMNDIADRFQEGIREDGQKFQTPIKMTLNGRTVNVPPDMVDKALKDGLQFQ